LITSIFVFEFELLCEFLLCFPSLLKILKAHLNERLIQENSIVILLDHSILIFITQLRVSLLG